MEARAEGKGKGRRKKEERGREKVGQVREKSWSSEGKGRWVSEGWERGEIGLFR